jgi:AraC-like DNA-binding protein
MSQPFLFEYELDDLFAYCSLLAGALHTPVVNNGFHYPDDIACGTSKFFRINEYISFHVANFSARERMTFSRIPGKRNHIVINFQDFSFSKCTLHNFQCNEIILTNNKIGSIQCRHAMLAEAIVIDPGLQVRMVTILLDENWMTDVLKDEASKEKFRRYLAGQDLSRRKEYLSAEQKKLFCEIMDRQPVSQLESLYYEGRVMNLLESFLSDVLQKEESTGSTASCSDEDITMIQLAEKAIADNVMNPFSGVDRLSRLCCMSRTKFINLFHKIYGVSSFEYYQKKRLRIAYDMLKSGKYSVTDTANHLGYTGITNFAQAFKRDFGILPSDLLEEVRSYS